ncbi:MAG: Aldo/keto reductase, partial [uncultured Solirubrobacteraceae bacterium]
CLPPPAPHRRSARPASTSPVSASAHGRSEVPGTSAGGRRTSRIPWPPSTRRSTRASTGSTPPPSTGSATPRRWWGARCASCP